MANVFDLATGAVHAVCESSRLKATKTGHIYDLKCHKALDNGAIVGVGTHVEGQVFNSKDYAAGDITCLILTPPFAYNGNKYQSEEKFFYNEKDEIARAYELHVGDIYTISEAGLASGAAVGKYVNAAGAISASAGTSLNVDTNIFDIFIIYSSKLFIKVYNFIFINWYNRYKFINNFFIFISTINANYIY